jgi:prepilin-type N-terminal cleavage/methylation domain-containing protein
MIMRSAECGMRNGKTKGRAPVLSFLSNSACAQRLRAASRVQGEFRIPNSKGFTLIELTVVMVVLGVMLALVVPKLGELGEANLKRSARHLTGMIRFLRDEAQAKKTVYRLRFDIPAGRYWAEVLSITSDQTVEFKQLYSEMAAEGSLSGQTSFLNVKAGSHPDELYIQFTPDGWVEKSFIYLKDGSDRPFTLIIQPLTGNTELREGYVEEKG